MLQLYCASLTEYKRLPTREVKIGDLALGNGHPILIQTMTTTDTMDTAATVAQSIRCIEAGAELVRITAPSRNEAENLLNIKKGLRARGYNTPLVADIHFTPNAAEIAARIVEKVRVNPGNYVDKKKFDFIDYTDAEYGAEVDRIRERFTPLVRICREYGTAMRIGTNHGSLSDRIMSRYGDTPIGMVESAMEFLRIARGESYHQVVLSMKSSNPLVMVQAYRLLVQQMDAEFGECYPLHLGVTEAGDGEDGRIKSAIGIGALLEDGIGDTIRVSLTEDPEFEIPVCRDIVKRYTGRDKQQRPAPEFPVSAVGLPVLPYSPFAYKRRETTGVHNIGAQHVPVVVADLSRNGHLSATDLLPIGYTYNEETDKWTISDGAADFIYTADSVPDFALPGTLQVICNPVAWQGADKAKCVPIYDQHEYLEATVALEQQHFIRVDAANVADGLVDKVRSYRKAVLVVSAPPTHSDSTPHTHSPTHSDSSTLHTRSHAPTDSTLHTHSHTHSMPMIRRFIAELMDQKVHCPVILQVASADATVDEQLIHLATEAGGLLLDGFGDGIWLRNTPIAGNMQMSGRTYLPVNSNEQFLNNTAFSILQATRTRISKTEYISCPSCGRTLFDLQETTAKIRAATHHLKGVKIAIMGCIVNGPGEMADADFGYVGSGPGKITLYKGKDVVKRNVPSEIAVDELINVLKENDAWV